MNIKQEIGERIRRVRKKRGLTQEQLAEMVDITSRNLSNIELGISFPKSETLEKIIKFLEISTQDLFANDDINSNEELLNKIYNLLETVKSDNRILGRTYRVLKGLLAE